MTITLQAVNELIQSLKSVGELSIREQKFLKLAKAYQQLAAENVALKAVFSQEEIPSEAVDAFMETAVMDHDWNETSEWSWVENETEVIHAVLDALKPDTPATDRIVAGIKADGVEEFVSNTVHKIFDESEAVSALAYLSLANSHVKKLREGADK
ncbi:dynein light chain family protein [Klebsiella pneumoniae]